METPREYYYTYYSYEEWGRGYFGSRKCYCLPEEDVKYLGSSKDKTFKPKYKIILKDDYATREEAYADEIILQQYYKVVENPHFANRAYQTSKKFYVSTEQARKNGKKGGKVSGEKHKENGTGVCGRSKEKMSEDGKKASQKNKENGTAIFGIPKEQKIKNSKKGGKISGKITGQKTYELGVGVHGRTKEQMSEDGKKGAQKTKELGIGIYAITKEQKIQIGKKSTKIINSQKWMCTETGYISTPGGLSSYQRARGIDTSKRKRIA